MAMIMMFWIIGSIIFLTELQSFRVTLSPITSFINTIRIFTYFFAIFEGFRIFGMLIIMFKRMFLSLSTRTYQTFVQES